MLQTDLLTYRATIRGPSGPKKKERLNLLYNVNVKSELMREDIIQNPGAVAVMLHSHVQKQKNATHFAFSCSKTRICSKRKSRFTGALKIILGKFLNPHFTIFNLLT